MTPGLSEDIRVMYGHTFLNLQITRSDIRLDIKWAVSLVFTYGHFNISQEFVWVWNTMDVFYLKGMPVK